MRLRAIYYRITKDRKFRLAGLILLVVVLFGLILARSAAIKFFASPEQRAAFLRDHPAVVKVLPLYWSIRKLSDLRYLPYFFRKDNVPAYELVIAQNDLKKINDSLPKEFMNVVYTDKVFVPAEFRAGGKTYQVRVRYRGINGIHWNAEKKSYLLKFDPADLFQGMGELNFIVPDDRLFAVEHFNNYRAQKLGLKVPRSGFANLKVNDKKTALYFAIEGWSQEMLEKWGLPEDTKLYGNQYGGDWKSVDGWDLMVAGSASPPDHTKLAELLRLVYRTSDEEFYAKIFKIVDKDNFYAWQIHQELANSSHEHTDNQRFYLDPVSGKFFFAPWDVDMELIAAVDNFGQYSLLSERIFSNPVFLQEKNLRLSAYLADEKNLEDDLRFYDETYESFKISLYRDRLKVYTNRHADQSHETYRQNLIDIFYHLREELAAGNSTTGNKGTARIEDDFNLAYPLGKSDELVAYLQKKYLDDSSFARSLGTNFSSSYSDEDFTDTYFDTARLDLYERQAGLRYRLRVNRQDPEDQKSGRELVQLKLSGADKFADTGNLGSRNEIKFEVDRTATGRSADDNHPLLKFLAAAQREELKARLLELQVEVYDLRPILTITQHRRRVYLDRDGETFISFSMDDASARAWWAKEEFSQMEVELNELVYTAADPFLQKRMQEIREVMIEDLRAQFDYLQDDQTIKYTKMFNALASRLPGMRFLIRLGILRGS